ncbi:hypothetical protein GOV08_03530 [Candidatus Woesearchaeota archaeon]|nr:hypothetical protein [Candidatus Woesearchaeota archaeon]
MTEETVVEEIRKLVEENKAVIGTEKTIKELRTGRISKVFIAQNTNEEVKADLKKNSKISGIEVVELEIKNDEFGTICKKPFPISVLGRLK